MLQSHDHRTNSKHAAAEIIVQRKQSEGRKKIRHARNVLFLLAIYYALGNLDSNHYSARLFVSFPIPYWATSITFIILGFLTKWQPSPVILTGLIIFLLSPGSAVVFLYVNTFPLVFSILIIVFLIRGMIGVKDLRSTINQNDIDIIDHDFVD